MKIRDVIYIFITLSVYFIATTIWLILYIFLGEDTELNTLEDYMFYGQYTGVYLLVILFHILYNNQKIVNVSMILVGVLLIPIIISGYLGAVNMSESVTRLSSSRMVTIIAFAIVYGIGIVKEVINTKWDNILDD